MKARYALGRQEKAYAGVLHAGEKVRMPWQCSGRLCGRTNRREQVRKMRPGGWVPL